MNLESAKTRWVVMLALSALGTVWHQFGKIEALERENGSHAAEAADLRAWRVSVEQALRNCKP
ncbi:MAG: hypothetical protein ACTHOL_17935 [Luteibacter jiangsuensis]